MLGFIPVVTPRVVVAGDASLAAVQEPTRLTLVALPSGQPFGVIETPTESDVGWLGARLLVLTSFAAHTRVRLVDPRVPRVLGEAMLAPGLRLRACVENFAILADDATTLILDANLATRPLRTRVTVVGATGAGFVGASAGALVEIDASAANTKRTWKVAGTVTGVGGNERSIWRTTREAPAMIEVVPLVSLGQPKQHELPEPIVQISGHPRSDLVACIGSSGHVFVVDLLGKAPVRALDARPHDRPETIALAVGFETHVVLAQPQRPTAALPLAPPTWRNELVAWFRSGTLDRYPHVPAIAELAAHERLDDELIVAITMCYAAALAGEPGVLPDELAGMLGGRWPDEVSGNGLLAESGVLVFGDWISIAPTLRQRLDDV